MLIIQPSWLIHATVNRPIEPGEDPGKRPVAVLSVSDNDLEVVLRVLKMNGFDKLLAQRTDF